MAALVVVELNDGVVVTRVVEAKEVAVEWIEE